MLLNFRVVHILFQPKMLQDVAASGSLALNGMMQYYQYKLNPPLSQQCSADLDQFVTDLQSMSFSNPKSMWAPESEYDVSI